MKMKRKILAAALCLILITGALGAPVFAAEKSAQKDSAAAVSCTLRLSELLEKLLERLNALLGREAPKEDPPAKEEQKEEQVEKPKEETGEDPQEERKEEREKDVPEKGDPPKESDGAHEENGNGRAEEGRGDRAEENQAENAVLSFEEEVARLVNAERAKYGLAPLKLSPELSDGAREKSADMANNRYFSHVSPTFGSPFDHMKARGISYRSAGENIAMGYLTPEAVMRAWMNSEGHRKNILSPNYSEIGVGYVREGAYVTQWFKG